MDPPPPPPTASSSPPSTPTSQSSTPSASRTALARKKKAIRSNFDAQYDHLLQTVIKNDTGSTTRDWQPTQSTRNPSSKASEAAYKGWVSRRGITPAIPSPAVPVAFPAPQLQPFQLPIPTPTPRARGLSYVPLPAGHGALGLVRGANQPIGANEQDQKLSDEARGALKQHYKAYDPPAERLKEPHLSSRRSRRGRRPARMQKRTRMPCRSRTPSRTPRRARRVVCRTGSQRGQML